MLGYRLFRHSILMLVNNFGAALKVSLIPGAISVATIYSVIGLARQVSSEDPATSPAIWFGVLISLIVTILVFCWAAVSWHRYVLQEEMPGAFFPAWHGPEIKAYIGASIRIVSIICVLALVLAAVIAFIAAALSWGSLDTRQSSVGTIIFNLLIGYFWLRYGLILPSAALGVRMSLGESWGETKPYAGAVFVAQLCSSIFFAIPTVIANSPFGAPLSGFAYFAVGGWLQVMVGISLLTALYGHIHEKRELI